MTHMLVMRSACLVLPTAFLLFSGCGGPDREAATASALQSMIESAPREGVTTRTWDETGRYYAARSYRPAWTPGRGYERVRLGLAAIQRAAEHGLPGDYGAAIIERELAAFDADKTAAKDPVRLAALDLQVTTNLLSLAHDVAYGRLSPARIQRSWNPARDVEIDFAAALERSPDDPSAFLESVQPRHREYAALSKALKATLDEATTPAAGEDRVNQLSINLERWRWMPDDLGSRHIFVNIPSFDLKVREGDRTVLEMPVVVGKNDGHETPVFSDVMETVVFSPYWNVPERIALDETAPAAAKDHTYIEKHAMEVFKRGKRGLEPIDAASVDWDDAAAVRQLVIRQRPGQQNALGGVKFLFPNEFDVYLHDTPADRLFSRPSRAFSHGCVRVSQPEALAGYLLRDAKEWDRAAIERAMAAGTERAVPLKDKVPVHIVYFTAWVDADGTVHYEKDVYGLDQKHSTLSSRQENE